MWQDQKYTTAEDGAYANNRSVGKAGKWNHALKYCRKLNYAGYSDWRLPTSDELTQVHRLDGQVFSYFRDKDFWTSTPTTEGRYYVIYPADAYPYKRQKKESNFIRCVRCTGEIIDPE
jgi:formylglycine-generating enzyme required for sulfatase activity